MTLTPAELVIPRRAYRGTVSLPGWYVKACETFVPMGGWMALRRPPERGTLVWLPDGRAGRITVYDPAHERLEVGPLPWYTRAIRRLLGKPNRRAPFAETWRRQELNPPDLPADSCPKGMGADV